MAEGSSIESVRYRYRMPQHEKKMTAQSYPQGINRQNCISLFQYPDWLSRDLHLKL